MKRILLFAFCLAAAVSMPFSVGFCCSSFHFSEGELSIVGKNYDWMVKGGLIFINKRAVLKNAFVRKGQEAYTPAKWVSKYGSVTFCQYGVELPGDGMNEKGLYVSSQALPGMRYPEVDNRPSVERRQWLQYQLDNYATVEEVVANFDEIQIRPDSFASHYFIADATGKSAVIEFVDRKAKIYTGRSLPHRVLTNFSYRKCSKYVDKALPEMDPHRNIDRFVTAAKALKVKRNDIASDPIDASFGLLKEISQGDFTKWSAVYDTQKLQIFYRSSGNANIRFIDLKRLDLSCNTPIQMLDIDHPGEGDMTGAFKNFNTGLAYNIVYSAFDQSPFIQKVDPAQILHRVTYVNQHICITEKATKKAVHHTKKEMDISDEAAVEKVIDAWESHWNAMQVDKLLGLIHDEDAQIMYGWSQLANKEKYARIVKERMESVGSFKLTNRKFKVMDNKATVEVLLKMVWGKFPTTFKLKKENHKWLVTSFKYKL